ncbi:endolytic transglycosylase MltG [Candidatus Parcubacteria bacterium]|nr:endolytic transglycosylase MltG [Candidatus Parcubacteria bacterium]
MKKILVVLISFFVFIFVFLFSIYAWLLPCRKSGFFEIKQGNGLIEIAEDLKKQGFIQMELPFCAFVSWKEKSRQLKAGVYSFRTDDTFLTIAEKIINGENYKIKITIPEGFTLEQIDSRLAENVTRSDLVTLDAGWFKDEFEFLKDAPENDSLGNDSLGNVNLEGFLFPDTYYFSGQENPEQITKIFLDNFDEKLTLELRQEIEKQNKTIFEIIIMASLIEKEVRTFEDKQIVSGILWKRLNAKMPLQVCATIAYITGKNTVKTSTEETQIDSPYNTYKYLGLPIGPICNPGLDSIKVAIYPKDSAYWYYLSAPTGETIFSKNLEQHNIAKAKYLKN